MLISSSTIHLPPHYQLTNDREDGDSLRSTSRSGNSAGGGGGGRVSSGASGKSSNSGSVGGAAGSGGTKSSFSVEMRESMSKMVGTPEERQALREALSDAVVGLPKTIVGLAGSVKKSMSQLKQLIADFIAGGSVRQLRSFIRSFDRKFIYLFHFFIRLFVGSLIHSLVRFNVSIIRLFCWLVGWLVH